MCRKAVDSTEVLILLKKDQHQLAADKRAVKFQVAYNAMAQTRVYDEMKEAAEHHNGQANNTLFTPLAKQRNHLKEDIVYLRLTYASGLYESDYVVICHTDDKIKDIGAVWHEILWSTQAAKAVESHSPMLEWQGRVLACFCMMTWSA